jgi:4-amino-4-deoxy-L-arabinose transferase-like glycosyltransferase
LAVMPTDDRSRRRRTTASVAVLAIILAIAPVLVLNQFISHGRPYLADEYLFASFGYQLLCGRQLYVDVWDNKPPGIYWVNAVAQVFAPGHAAGVIALTAIAMGAALGLFAAATWRLYGQSTAVVMAVVAPLFITHQLYHAGCNRPGTWLVLCQMLAAMAYLRALRRDRATAWWLVGLAGAAGVCFLQNGFGMLVGIVLHQLWLLAARFVAWRALLRHALHILVGLLIGLAVQVAILAATSNLPAAWGAIISFNVGYFEPGMGSRALPESGGWRWIDHLDAMAVPLLLALAATVHWLVNWRNLRRGAPDDPPTARDPVRCQRVVPWLLAWTLAEIYLAMLGPHHRMHYFIPVLPPLLLLGGRAVHLMLRDYGLLASAQRHAAVALALCWLGYMMIRPVQIQLHELGRAFYSVTTKWDMQYVVDEIKKRTAPREGIFVFGYHPRLYWDSGRFCGIKYLGTEKTWQLGQHVADDLVAELKRRRPKLVIVSASDLEGLAHPGVGPNFDDLRPWLEANYSSEEVGQVLFLTLDRRPDGQKIGA